MQTILFIVIFICLAIIFALIIYLIRLVNSKVGLDDYSKSMNELLGIFEDDLEIVDSNLSSKEIIRSYVYSLIESNIGSAPSVIYVKLLRDFYANALEGIFSGEMIEEMEDIFEVHFDAVIKETIKNAFSHFYGEEYNVDNIDSIIDNIRKNVKYDSDEMYN